MRRRAEAPAHEARPGAGGHHTCRECPICGTEECRVMADLGMACDTVQAAQEARAAQEFRTRRPARRASVRRH
jgi:hypothetical protein